MSNSHICFSIDLFFCTLKNYSVLELEEAWKFCRPVVSACCSACLIVSEYLATFYKTFNLEKISNLQKLQE